MTWERGVYVGSDPAQLAKFRFGLRPDERTRLLGKRLERGRSSVLPLPGVLWPSDRVGHRREHSYISDGGAGET
jgi:hypothetical protein